MQKRVRITRKKVNSISFTATARPKVEDPRENSDQSRLVKPHSSRNQSLDRKKSVVPGNVNSFRHLMNENTSEPDIEWVLKLRTPSESTKNIKLEPTALQPFSFDGKGIEGQKLGRICSDLNPRNHLYKVNHLFFHRRGPTASQGSVQFETGLRSYEAASEKFRELEKNWKNAPKKDRREFPELYPSYEETTKIKSWSTKNLEIKTHTGFEGHLNYPKYGELYNRQTKSIGEIRHLLSTPGRLMSGVDWQLSMRQYNDPKKAKASDAQNDQENNNDQRELRKISKKPNRI